MEVVGKCIFFHFKVEMRLIQPLRGTPAILRVLPNLSDARSEPNHRSTHSGGCCSPGNRSKSNAETVSKGALVDRSLPDCASTRFGVRRNRRVAYHHIMMMDEKIARRSDNHIAGKRATLVIFVHLPEGYIRNEGNRSQRQERRSPCGGRHQLPMICWILHLHLGSKAHERIQSAPVAAHFARSMPLKQALALSKLRTKER